MSLNHLPKPVLAIVEDMGWNEESVLLHLAGFMEHADNQDEYEAYLRAAAGEEGVDVESDDDAETVIAAAGWDEDSQLVHLAGFIADQGMNDELQLYLETIAEEERRESEEEEEG